MNIKSYLSSAIRKAMDELQLPEECGSLVTQSTRPEFGDYQANAALPAAKQLGTNPRELAQRIIERLDLASVADKIEIAGPGFINIHLRADWLAARCADIVKTQGKLEPQDSHSLKRFVVDYSHPNLAKEMHVGHLRSTIIGDALVRVLEHMGHEVIRQNHMGDWGTQFGMLIAELESRLSGEQSPEWALADLESFYQQAKKHFDADPVFADKARNYVVKLQSGDAHCLALWRQFIQVSVQHSEEIYQRLNVTLKHQDIRAESAYNDRLAGIVELLQAQGLAVSDQGAKVVFLDELADKDGNPSPVIVQKSDGGYLYSTTDLAAIEYRCQQLKADQVLYVVDARQSLHLQQVFLVARKAGLVPDSVELKHLPFGTMMGVDGKPFKTRSGGTVKLTDLLDEAIARAERLIAEKNPRIDAGQRKEVARKVGIGAVKYADLAKNRTSDYLFNWDAMLSFEGNTAPYLQYAYTRIQSLFRKAGIDLPAAATLNLEQPAERALALKLTQFREALEQVAKDCAPNLLCTYLYELASLYMSFYEACPILKEDIADEVRESRLQLCRATSLILAQGLGLLGIEVMDAM